MQTTLDPVTEAHSETALIRQRLAEGRSLAAAAQPAAAAVLWSAFESAVRLSLAELGEQTDRPIWLSDTPRGLASQAVAYGVLDSENRDVLLRFLQEYEEAAVGKAGRVDRDLLRKVGFFTERTLDELGQS